LSGWARSSRASNASTVRHGRPHSRHGDIVALVEDVKKAVDVDSAQKFAKRMQAGERFDLNDFREQVGQMRKMGGLAGLVDKLPASSRRPAR